MTTKCPNCGIELSAPIQCKGQVSGRKFFAITILGLIGVGTIATIAYTLSHCIIIFGRFACF